jgi:hypothetical protein
MGQGMKPGFTQGMEEERDRRRKTLLASVLMESCFCANDVARLLSDHKNGKPVSKDAAKKFLDAMVDDRLITRVARQDRALWCKRRISIGTGPWVKRDNGIPLGQYYGYAPVTIEAIVERHTA